MGAGAADGARGFHGNLAGWLGLLPTPEGRPFVVAHEQGTLSIDLVDAKHKQLVWQGVAEGEVSDESQRNPGPAIDNVVAELFSNFPYPPK